MRVLFPLVLFFVLVSFLGSCSYAVQDGEFSKQSLSRPRRFHLRLPLRFETVGEMRQLVVDQKNIVYAPLDEPLEQNNKQVQIAIIESFCSSSPTFNLTTSSLRTLAKTEKFLDKKSGKGNHAIAVMSVISGANGLAPKAPIHLIDLKGEAAVYYGNYPAMTSYLSYSLKNVLDRLIYNKAVFQLFGFNWQQSLAKAIRIATEDESAIINISMDFSFPDQNRKISQCVKDALIKSAQAGKIIVKSADNWKKPLEDTLLGRDMLDLASSPEMMGRLILVGSVGGYEENKEEIAPHSNTPGIKGANYFITAPGKNLYLPFKYNEDTNQYDNVLISGTSFTAPQVSAALQLLITKYPGHTPEEYVQHLYKKARKGDLYTHETFSPEIYGAGVLDVEALLATEPNPIISLEPVENHIKKLTSVSEVKPLGYLETLQRILTAECRYIINWGAHIALPFTRRLTRIWNWN